jgi:hypothetical protein
MRQVINNATLSYYWSPQPGQGCGEYQAAASAALRPFGLLPFLSFPSPTQDVALLSGSHRLAQNCLDLGTNSTGALHHIVHPCKHARVPTSCRQGAWAWHGMLLWALRAHVLIPLALVPTMITWLIT